MTRQDKQSFFFCVLSAVLIRVYKIMCKVNTNHISPRIILCKCYISKQQKIRNKNVIINASKYAF